MEKEQAVLKKVCSHRLQTIKDLQARLEGKGQAEAKATREVGKIIYIYIKFISIFQKLYESYFVGHSNDTFQVNQIKSFFYIG